MGTVTTRLLSCCLAASVLAGCLARPELKRENFLLSAKRPSSGSSGTGGKVLSVRLLQVAPQFENQGFVYRSGDARWESDYYHQFPVSPSENLTEVLRRWMSDSGRFKNVVIPGAGVVPDILLEGYVSELYGDFREPGPGRAVLTMRLVALAGEGSSRSILMSRIYSEAVILEKRNPAALVSAWDVALARILAKAEGDVGAL